jgi:hypothetical protein
MWWFAANITIWLFGALSFELGKWLMDELSLSRNITPAFPMLASSSTASECPVTAPYAVVDDRDPSTPGGR